MMGETADLPVAWGRPAVIIGEMRCRFSLLVVEFKVGESSEVPMPKRSDQKIVLYRQVIFTQQFSMCWVSINT